jgi:hypothetical protein
VSGLSPPVFATLFRQLLQRDTTLGATRGRRGLRVPPGLTGNGCPEAYGLPIAIFTQLSRLLLHVQLILMQSLSLNPELDFSMPVRLSQMMLCKHASHCIIQRT